MKDENFKDFSESEIKIMIKNISIKWRWKAKIIRWQLNGDGKSLRWETVEN